MASRANSDTTYSPASLVIESSEQSSKLLVIFSIVCVALISNACCKFNGNLLIQDLSFRISKILARELYKSSGSTLINFTSVSVMSNKTLDSIIPVAR